MDGWTKSGHDNSSDRRKAPLLGRCFRRWLGWANGGMTEIVERMGRAVDQRNSHTPQADIDRSEVRSWETLQFEPINERTRLAAGQGISHKYLLKKET